MSAGKVDRENVSPHGVKGWYRMSRPLYSALRYGSRRSDTASYIPASNPTPLLSLYMRHTWGCPRKRRR